MSDKIILAKVGQLIKVKKIADGRTETMANQGQALDGYSELANYRSIIGDLEDLFND